jgi:hypothetical protein
VFLGRVPGWKIALILAAAFAAVVALAIVAGALFLLILPVILVAGLAHRLFGARRRGEAPRGPGLRRPGRGPDRHPIRHPNRDVIEGVFVSVSEERREIDPGKGEGKRRE